MSETKDNGGPAFPRTEDAINHRNRDWDLDGMSLRDYFAAKAIQGLLANPDWTSNEAYRETSNEGDLPTIAYKVADAMLQARKL